MLGIIVHLELGRPRATPKDPGSAAVSGLTDLTIVVRRRASLADVPGVAEEPVGRKLLLAGAALAVLGPVLLTLLAHRLGMSPARSGGLIATSRAADERVNEGYATRFALDTILKVLLVQVIVGLGGGKVPL